MKYTYFWILTFIAVLFFTGCGNEALQKTLLFHSSDNAITAPPEEVWQAIQHIREEQNISLTAQQAFYTKYIDAAGIAILANTHVADEYLIDARHIIVALTSKRPELREMLTTQKPKDVPLITVNTEGALTLYGQGFYLILHNANYWEVPELSKLPTYIGSGSCYMRGSRRSGVIGYCFADIDPPHGRNGLRVQPLHTFVHEFGHAIHMAIRLLDPTFDDRLQEAYAHQIGNPNTWTTGAYAYAQTNFLEYYAVAIELWCYGIGKASIPTHEDFRERDPMLTELIEEWLPRLPLAR